MFPSPTLFPGGSEGLSFATKFWADRLLFMAAVPARFSKIGPAVPEAFIGDRRALMGAAISAPCWRRDRYSPTNCAPTHDY